MTWKNAIANFWQNIVTACVRFPLSLACSVIASVLLIYGNHLNSNSANDVLGNNLLRLALEAIAGIPMFYAFHIFSENKNLDIFKRIGFVLLGLGLLGLHFYSIPNGTYHFDNNYTIRYLTLLASVHLIISFSLYYTPKDVESFWYYNEFLFVRFITVVLFSITFYLGIIGAMWSLEKLLQTPINYKYYYDVFLLIMIPFNTLFFYSRLPADSHHFEKQREYQNALRIFIQYILVPIILIYGIILAVYLVKLIINGEAPSGTVCLPILIYSALGLLTYLLAYPIREGKHFIITWFYKYFYFALLPMLALFFKAIISQIAKYGFTETRYLTLALGIWLVVVCLYAILKTRINIILLPITLCLVCIFSTFGPWGMYNTSGYSQYRRLKNTLQENNLLVNGKININANSQKSIDKNNTEAILSAIQYLYTHHQIERIKPLLSEKDFAKLVSLEKNGLTEGNARSLLGFDSEGLIDNVANATKYTTLTNTNMGMYGKVFNVAPYSNLVQLNAVAYDAENVELNMEPTVPKSVLRDNILLVYINKDTFMRTSVNACEGLLTRVVQQQQSDSSIIKYAIEKMELLERQYLVAGDSLVVNVPNGKLYIDEIKYKIVNKKPQAVQINGLLAY